MASNQYYIKEPAVAAPTRPASPVRRFVGRYMYRWHRLLGLLTVVPVVLWALSGLSHPLMSNLLRPTIAHETVPAPPLTAAALAVPVAQVLAWHHLPTVQNVRVVWANKQAYYQVTTASGKLRYFGTADGRELPGGDRAYAEAVARYLLADSTSAVASAERLTRYTADYKFINRLLPVWKITFARPDGMAVFIETGHSRLGTFNNHARATFLWVFGMMHNWDFLDGLPRPLHLGIMLVFTTIIWLSALSGLVIYGFVRGKMRQPRSAQDAVGWLRKRHRTLGLWVAFVTFTFALSASYHLWQKFTPDRRDDVARVSLFAAKDLTIPLAGSLAYGDLATLPITQVSLARVGGQPYYRLVSKAADGHPTVQYRSTRDGQLLPDGEFRYAAELGQEFMAKLNTTVPGAASATNPESLSAAADCCEAPGLVAETKTTIGTPAASPAPAQANLASPELVTKFAGEYGFVNKRLPVVKLAFAGAGHPALYVEPATGRLAAYVTDDARREGLSFAVLHKFFLMDWAGKTVRDFVAMFSALGVLVVTLYGLVLLLRR